MPGPVPSTAPVIVVAPDPFKGSLDAELVADPLGLGNALVGADWLITGEGRCNAQTLHGKAPFIACRRAARTLVPATSLSGALDPDVLPRLSEHFASRYRGPMSLDAATRNAPMLLRRCRKAACARQIHLSTLDSLTGAT